MAGQLAALQNDNLNTEGSPETRAREYLSLLYQRDDRPWVVAYSGGKDSTAVLHLVYSIILELGKAATKPVFVISSDTRVEAPNIVAYIESVLAAVGRHAEHASLPVTTEIVRPAANESFWGKLIGLGYPSPTRWFRWCTTNMKIKPSRRAIDKITAQYGSVVLLLGSRLDESDDRRRRMEARNQNSAGLNLHHEIPNAYVATPIANWSTDEVWEFLFENNPAPWDRSHDQLLELYRQANGGECPVVMDLNTPSCGGSRFGCWTCTVVKMDRSMEGFIEAGDEWMRPLNEFRNWLKDIREDSRFRQQHRRDGSPGYGPFTYEARLIILKELLRLEQKLNLRHDNLTLISDDELVYIQSIWSDEFDLKRSAMALAKEFGRDLGGSIEMQLDDDDKKIIEQLIGDYSLPEDLVWGLFELEDRFPNLDALGSKSEIRRELQTMIENAVNHATNADPTK